MNEENEIIYNEQFSDGLDEEELNSARPSGDFTITSNELGYDMWVRQPQSEIDYLNKDLAGANLDTWEINKLNALFVYLKNLKALGKNNINTDEAQERTKEKISQTTVTSTGKDGFMQKIRVTRNIHRTGEYTTIEDKKSPVQFFSRKGRN